MVAWRFPYDYLKALKYILANSSELQAIFWIRLYKKKNYSKFVCTVDASQAGEGNLEITISARGRNIPTKVHPQGSARFAVSFVPLEAIDHIITITFNKEAVPGNILL